ncbi:MAG: type II secretion system protein [Planctomycetia bacterium]|nr:type II secretion system protein [Planctomycetia bacterium]
MKNKSSKNGFSLLEILVVLVILMFGLTVLSQLMNASMRQSILADEQTAVQIFCQNTMSRILSGEMAVLSGMNFPVESQPHWQATVLLEQGILPNILTIRIIAQKYEEKLEPSPDQPGRFITSFVPVGGQNIVITQWVRRNAVKLQTLNTNSAFLSPDSFETSNQNPIGIAESGYFQTENNSANNVQNNMPINPPNNNANLNNF